MDRTIGDNVNKKPGKKSAEVFDAIHRIMHQFRSAQYRVLRDGPYELTHMEGKLLGYFSQHPGATLRDLVAHLKQDKGQLGRLIKSLKEQGLLAGQSDEGDRRSVRLRLTPEGEKVHLTLQRQVRRLSDLAVKGLTAEQFGQLADLLHQVRANLEKA